MRSGNLVHRTKPLSCSSRSLRRMKNVRLNRPTRGR
jgi:hypothetical protein